MAADGATPGSPPQPSADGPGTGSRAVRTGISVGAVVLALLIGIGIGVLLSSYVSSDDTAVLEETEAQLSELREATARLEERNWKLYRERELAEERLAQASGTSTAADQAGADSAAAAEGVFADGVYLVPEELPPGTYDGVVTGDFGYWARLKNTAGVVSSIEANGVVTGPFVLTVNPSDRAVELRGVVVTALE